jgi:hypothetical protein
MCAGGPGIRPEPVAKPEPGFSARSFESHRTSDEHDAAIQAYLAEHGGLVFFDGEVFEVSWAASFPPLEVPED